MVEMLNVNAIGPFDYGVYQLRARERNAGVMKSLQIVLPEK